MVDEQSTEEPITSQTPTKTVFSAAKSIGLNLAPSGTSTLYHKKLIIHEKTYVENKKIKL